MNTFNKMSPRERVFARLESKPVDRIPNLSILMTFAAKYIGCSYDQYVQDYHLLVDGNLRCCEDFDIDMVSAISDPVRETSDFGANIVFPFDAVPYASANFIKHPIDIQKLKVQNPQMGRRMADRIRAVELFKQKVGEHYPILGWVEGAFGEVCDLHGVSETMEDLFAAPEFILEMLEICTQQAIYFAEAQIDSGADFIGIGDAAASLISPRMYRKFVLPYEQRIIHAIYQKGAKAKLHICGNTSALLKIFPETSADIIDIDYPVNFSDAVQMMGESIAVCGNFEPTAVLLQGDLGSVEKSVRHCVAVSNQNTMIAPGCEVPRDTPNENLKAISKTLWEINGVFIE